jgi:tartrate dehydratase alpha subunit/fumarate hydratase class I-like protein
MKALEKQFSDAFYESLVRGVTSISPDILQLLKEARQGETPQGKSMMDALIENADLAQNTSRGVCQSPGIPCIYVRTNPDLAGIVSPPSPENPSSGRRRRGTFAPASSTR